MKEKEEKTEQSVCPECLQPTTEVGLHPKDIDKILDLICKEVKEGCKDTKRCVEEFNKEREYLSGTLNVK